MRSILHLVPFVLLLASACTDQGPENRGPRELLEVGGSAPTAHSGETTNIVIRVLDADGRSRGGVELSATAEADATVSPGTAISGTDGTATFAWTLADRDETQQLVISAGTLELVVRREASPRIVALSLAPSDTTITALGADVPLRLTGRTATGRSIALAPHSVRLTEQSRGYADVAVLTPASGSGVRTNGPGVAEVFFSVDGMESSAAVVRVESDQPVVTGLLTSRVAMGEKARLAGHRLAALGQGAVRLGGQALAFTTSADTLLEVSLPSVPRCSGRGRVQLVVPMAHVVGPLDLIIERPGDVVLQVGEYRELTDSAALDCVELRAVRETVPSYALLYADTRLLEASRAVAESRVTPPAAFTLDLADATTAVPPPATAPSSASPARAPLTRDPTLFTRPVGPPPADYYMNRTTPWAVGDRVSVDDGERYLPGTVFFASARFAVATVDRDAAFDVARRVIGLDSIILHLPTAESLFVAALGGERVETGRGTGQFLVVIGALPHTGGQAFLHRSQVIGGARVQGALFWINPGVGLQTGQLWIPPKLFLHELAHLYEDRLELLHCQGRNGDCLILEGFYSRWAAEGVADLLAESAILRWRELGPMENVPLANIQRLNVLGTRSTYGARAHYNFSRGYNTSVWYLYLATHEMMRSGATLREALEAVATGAMEGWFGVGVPNETVAGDGFARRIGRRLGATFDPGKFLVRGVARLATDDALAGVEHQYPVFQSAGEYYAPAFTFRSGAGERMTETVGPWSFAYYLVEDSLGGSYRIQAPPGLRWAIVRLR